MTASSTLLQPFGLVMLSVAVGSVPLLGKGLELASASSMCLPLHADTRSPCALSDLEEATQSRITLLQTGLRRIGSSSQAVVSANGIVQEGFKQSNKAGRGRVNMVLGTTSPSPQDAVAVGWPMERHGGWANSWDPINMATRRVPSDEERPAPRRPLSIIADRLIKTTEAIVSSAWETRRLRSDDTSKTRPIGGELVGRSTKGWMYWIAAHRVKWWSIAVWACLLVMAVRMLAKRLKQDLLVQYLRAYVFHFMSIVLACICLFLALLMMFVAAVAVVWLDTIIADIRPPRMDAEGQDDTGLFWKGVTTIIPPLFSSMVGLLVLLLLLVTSTWFADIDVHLALWVQGSASEAPEHQQPSVTEVWSTISSSRSWRSLLHCLALKWPVALVGGCAVFSMTLLSLAFVTAPAVYAAFPMAWSHVRVYGEPLVLVESVSSSYRAMLGGLCLAPCAVLAAGMLAHLVAALTLLLVG
mmetsp:Transcript_20756/g.65487  ORF Transcript_20756/g.65487 Transcript_20756/m.65487 type:complete len:470 (-) Transcript_20756:96-1505(-)